MHRTARGLGVAFVATVLSTLAIDAIGGWVDPQGAGVVYLAGILVVAMRYGLAPGLAASVLSVAAFNFFFLPPVHTLTVNARSDWLTLLLFAAVAAVTSHLSARVRSQTETAERRRAEAELARDLATRVAQGDELDALVPHVESTVARLIGVRGVHAADDGSVRIDDPDHHLEPDDAARVEAVIANLLALARTRDRLLADRVEAAAVRRSDAAKTALLRAVSHDLRSPLTAIGTAAGTLRLAASGDDRELAETILEETTRLDRLVGDLLDLSRLEAGGVVPRADWVDVADVAEAAAREARTHRGAAVAVHAPEDVALARADPRHLERVLANLIDNAASFTPAGERVDVEIGRANGHVEVRVLDRGPGIADAERERIFEPFVRGTAGARRSGSGLGLAIARGLAEANDASVTVAPRPGGGAAFTLVLPAGRTP